MTTVPEQLIWEIVKKNNSFLVKEFGNGTAAVRFSKEPNNLYNLNSYKYSGGGSNDNIGVVVSGATSDVSVANHWVVNGNHYDQTSEEWLKRMNNNLKSVRPIMETTYGKHSATKWTVYWRTFFIAVAELFAYNNGEEWMVTPFLFKKR